MADELRQTTAEHDEMLAERQEHEDRLKKVTDGCMMSPCCTLSDVAVNLLGASVRETATCLLPVQVCSIINHCWPKSCEYIQLA